MHRIILTGGPGAGKTTVLERLRDMGNEIGTDAARTIIRERQRSGQSPRPDPETFARQILDREILAYQSASRSPTFFERGVPDAVGSLYASGAVDDREAQTLITQYRYFNRVFLFPPWKDIYRTDSERDHTFEHSVRVYESTRAWYARFGYETVEMPLETAEARAQRILREIT